MSIQDPQSPHVAQPSESSAPVPSRARGFSRASQAALELPSVLQLVAHHAATDLGHERLRTLAPFTDPDGLARHRQRYQEASRLLASQPFIPYCERPFLPLIAELANGGGRLTGRDLVVLGDLLRITSEARLRIDRAEVPCEALAELATDLPDLEELRRHLKKTFDARGEIREDATPRLATLRRQVRQVRQRIYDQLRTTVETQREHLGEDTIPMRGGRLVLVLQAGARGKVPGLVHGRSGSGKSFYFEPLETVEDNNNLQQASEEEEAEKRRILSDTIRRLLAALGPLEQHADYLAELDRLQASLRFAERSGGRLADLAPRRELVLVGARHPLLDPALAEIRGEALGTPGYQGIIVPLDLELSGQKHALVVTGPNAGGKTVALKTLGLLALVNQCGLPVPAEVGTRLPFLSAVVATVGDDQDLLADRSTFSGRLLRLREAWEAAGPDTLVLLDELGSGTDPDEGSALSAAILESLVERGCLMFVTTHLAQLAAAALEIEGAFCGAMLFDSERHQPTYRLLPGPPGASEALALARRLGLPDVWIERADELLGSEHRDLRRLLAELERSRQELAETRIALDTDLADARKLRQRLAEREQELADERKTLGKTFQRRLDLFQDEVRGKLAAELERLQDEVKKGRRKGLVSRASQRLVEEAPAFEPREEPTGEVTVGATVKHRRFGWAGTLEKLERGRAQVNVAGKSLSCEVDDLVPATASDTKKRPSKPSFAPRRSAIEATELEDSPPELKLIGHRVEPALDQLDRFLDTALLASRSSVRVVHGHGSGRLRSAVRDHLRGHPAVADQRPGRREEGGDGATVVTLRGA